MRQISLRTWVGIASSLIVGCYAATAVVGCSSGGGTGSSPASTGAESLREGLTVLNADAKVGVSAAFKRGGRVVYLQTRVGQLKEKPYLEAFPNEPDHEMDARVVDQEGRTFSLIIGGDHVIDDGWSADIKAASHLTTKAEGVQRNADFALARDAAKEFAGQAGPELGDHVYHLLNLTRLVPQEDTQMREGGEKADLGLPAERTYGTNGCNYNLQQGMLTTKPLGNGESSVTGILGEIAQYITGASHSAVTSWNYNGCAGSWDENLVACNHGTCANDGSMSASCSSYSGMSSATARSYGDNPTGWGGSWSAWNGNDLYTGGYFNYEANGSTTIGGGCWTGYGIQLDCLGTVYGNGSRGDGSNGNHVCNDDSARELQELVGEAGLSNNWSGGSGGNNGSFTCNKTEYQSCAVWVCIPSCSGNNTDIQPPNCP